MRKRANDWQPPPAFVEINDVVSYTRAKIEPMIRGLFPHAEREAVMTLLERSVVFLTPSNIEEVLRK